MEFELIVLFQGRDAFGKKLISDIELISDMELCFRKFFVNN